MGGGGGGSITVSVYRTVFSCYVHKSHGCVGEGGEYYCISLLDCIFMLCSQVSWMCWGRGGVLLYQSIGLYFHAMFTSLMDVLGEGGEYYCISQSDCIFMLCSQVSWMCVCVCVWGGDV